MEMQNEVVSREHPWTNDTDDAEWTGYYRRCNFGTWLNDTGSVRAVSSNGFEVVSSRNASRRR